MQRGTRTKIILEEKRRHKWVTRGLLENICVRKEIFKEFFYISRVF
jgi:hypothetical protein